MRAPQRAQMTRPCSSAGPSRGGLLRRSWPRVIELAYWPTMQMILWGFMTRFLLTSHSSVLRASGMLIAAVLLWDVLFRSNIGVAVSFLEEMWSRSLAQLFASPLRPIEWTVSLIGVSLVRTVIGVTPAALLAIPLYQYSIFDMGLPLLAFFFTLLLFGGALGLAISGLVLRYGLGAESLAWVGVFIIAPISGIYYPVATLPAWLQPAAWALPSSYVFEGMRTVRLRIPARAEYVALARLALSGLAEIASLPDDVLADLKLALTEAVSNSVRHAYDGGDGQVEIVYELAGHELRIEVVDDGAGFDPARPPALGGEELAAGGGQRNLHGSGHGAARAAPAGAVAG